MSTRFLSVGSKKSLKRRQVAVPPVVGAQNFLTVIQKQQEKVIPGLPTLTSDDLHCEASPASCPVEHVKLGRQCNPSTGRHYGAIHPLENTIVHMNLSSFNSQLSLPRDVRQWPTLRQNFPTITEAPVAQQAVGDIRNQGNTSTCWIQAFCALWYQEMHKIDPQCAYPSRLWIVANHLRYNCLIGGSPTDAAGIASSLGMLPEGIIADDITNSTTALNLTVCDNAAEGIIPASGIRPQSDILTPAVKATAAQYKTSPVPGGYPVLFSSYSNTSNSDKVKAIYTALAGGHSVLIFIAVGSEFTNYSNNHVGSTTYTPKEIMTLGTPGTDQHAVLFCGFAVVNGVPCFRVKNSWFSSWGEGGFAWLNVATAQSWSFGMTYAPDPSTGVSLPFGIASGTRFRGPAPGPADQPIVIPPRPGVPTNTYPIQPINVQPAPIIPTPTPVRPAPHFPLPHPTPAPPTPFPEVSGPQPTHPPNIPAHAPGTLVEQCTGCSTCYVPPGYTGVNVGSCTWPDGAPGCIPCQHGWPDRKVRFMKRR
jgi:hypothetical protein